MDKSAKKAIKEVFESNKNLKEVYACEDGQCFKSEDNARSHQSDTGKHPDKFELVQRGDYIMGVVKPTEAELKAKADAKAAKEAKAKEEAEKALKLKNEGK